MVDLATISSPYSGDTSSMSDEYSTCGNGREAVFGVSLCPGATLRIRQSSNSFESMHTLRFGGDCPGSSEVTCTDDPDDLRHSWTNDQGRTERVYFTISAYSGSGAFTLSWLVDGVEQQMTSVTVQGATRCEACPAGTSDHDSTSSTGCRVCALGQYTNASRATAACDFCSAGSFTPNTRGRA